MKVVLASSNQGKLNEFRELLKSSAIELIPQGELNIHDAEETGSSFLENALLKAKHASQLSGLPAIADDSGLSVDALNGAPGIYSARYAGEKATAKDNIAKLLQTLKNIPDNQRQASFHCVIAFIKSVDDDQPLIANAVWQGKILHQPQGHTGFGYDPIFYVPDQQKSAAELSPEIKNKLSHRGQALRDFINRLPEKLHHAGSLS